MINENVSFESRFKSKVVNENDIQREIWKPGTFGNISSRILKDSWGLQCDPSKHGIANY